VLLCAREILVKPGDDNLPYLVWQHNELGVGFLASHTIRNTEKIASIWLDGTEQELHAAKAGN